MDGKVDGMLANVLVSLDSYSIFLSILLLHISPSLLHSIPAFIMDTFLYINLYVVGNFQCYSIQRIYPYYFLGQCRPEI